MKVAITNYWFKTGGTENAMIGMVNELLKHGAEVTIVSYFDEGDLKSRIPKEVKYETIEHTFLKDAWMRDYSRNIILQVIQKVIHKLSQVFGKTYGENHNLYDKVLSKTKENPTEFDLVLDFFGYGHFMTAYAAKKIRARKKATWLHDENTSFAGRVRKYYDDYDAIFCVSNAVREDLLKRYPELESKTDVLYNFLDIDRIRTKSEEDCISTEDFNSKFCLLTAGRLTEQKGYDIAIKATEILKNKGLDFNWFVLGQGKERESLEALIRKCNVEDRFHLLGNVSNPFPYMKKCDLYVQPSRHEGYCTTLVEAKTLCKAILSSNIGSAREVLKEGETGYMCELTPEDLAEAIERLMNDRELISKVETNLASEKAYNSEDYKKIEKLMEGNS